jgi:DNA-binding NtrC family response regulator
MLSGYEWPGNVRELHNALERAAILCQGGLITGEHLSLRFTSLVAPQRPSNLSDVERRTIEQVLHEADGNTSKAARRSGITHPAVLPAAQVRTRTGPRTREERRRVAD